MKQVIYRNLKRVEVELTSHLVGAKRVLLQGSESESMLTQAAIGSFKKGEFVENHVHPTMEEFYFFTKGNAIITIDNVEFFCKKDTFIKIPKNTIHSLMAITSINFLYWGIAI